MPTPPHNFHRKAAKGKGGQKEAAAPPEVSNLETDGGRLKVYELAQLLKHKTPRVGHGGRTPDTLAAFVVPWFEKNVAKPGRQLAGVTEVWVTQVPAKLLPHTRLLSLNKGTLTVGVDNAIAKAELDAALRGGLSRSLRSALGSALYRVKLIQDSPNVPEIS